MIFILEQLLITFDKKETITNVKHVISLGGLQLLIQMFEHGSLEERTHISVLLASCIEADASSGSQIATNINKQCLLELIHSHQGKTRASGVLLLICLSRRKDLTSYLNGLQNEERVNTLQILLSHFQNSPHKQRPLLAVLLLHLDLLLQFNLTFLQQQRLK